MVARSSACSVFLVLLLLSCGSNDPPAFHRVNDSQIAALPATHPVVVLNFWATWCEPCVEEIPIFERLHRRDRDLTVVGISLDEMKDEPAVRAFIKEHHMTYEVVLREHIGDFEKMVNSIDRDWIGAVPATFVFKNGKRVFSKVGPVNEAELLKAVQS